jgi:hypothetical protein
VDTNDSLEIDVNPLDTTEDLKKHFTHFMAQIAPFNQPTSAWFYGHTEHDAADAFLGLPLQRGS